MQSHSLAAESLPSKGKGKAMSLIDDDDEDWLTGIDESLANAKASLDPQPIALHSSVEGDKHVQPTHSKVATMNIRGRASELSAMSNLPNATHMQIRHQGNGSLQREQADQMPRDQVGHQSLHPTDRHDSPLSTQSTPSSRPGSTPTSFLSANDDSQVSGSNSRVTLGAAAANWQFDHPGGGSWPKPIRRDQTMETRHSRFQTPSVMRLGNLTQAYSTVDGARRNYNQSSNMQGIRRFQPSFVRPGYEPHAPIPDGFNPRSRLNLPDARRPDPMGNVEIRIMNIPLGSSKDELYALLCDAALHRAPFSSREKKLNFW